MSKFYYNNMDNNKKEIILYKDIMDMIFINAFRVYEKQQNNIKITHMIFTAVFTFDSMLYIFTDFIYKKNYYLHKQSYFYYTYIISNVFVYNLILITTNSN